MHFTRLSAYADAPVPMIVRGDGPYIWDTNGKRYLDGLSGLFVVQAGHGRHELADAAAKQAGELAYFPLWSYAHPKAVELADRLADLAPGDLNRVFFTTGGSEAVESAWKLARSLLQADRQAGQDQGDLPLHRLPRHLDGRAVDHRPARHQGRLRAAGARPRIRVPNTNFYRRRPAPPGRTVPTPRRSASGPPTGSPRPSSSRARTRSPRVFLEPVQNSGGCFPPPPGYFQRVREICDRYDVLLVSDEVICAFGRLGEYFGAQRYGYQPDIITCAKGMTIGYVPLGAMIASRPAGRAVPARTRTGSRTASPSAATRSAAAVALANLDIFEREDLDRPRPRATRRLFRSHLERLIDLPIVGDVRGDGYFFGIELVKDKATKETFNDDESERLLRGFLSKALFDAGLYCRADDRGDPVVQLAPPLICDEAHFAEIEQILRAVLTEAWTRL